MRFFTSFLLLFISVGCCMGQEAECPDGWRKFKDEKCYLLLSSYSTYAGAKEQCLTRGGRLAHVKDQDEQDFLTNFLFRSSNVEVGIWIGGTRSTSTKFQWEDHSLFKYSNWDPDSPSQVLGTGRDCVAMQSRHSLRKAGEEGQWKDYTCNSAYFSVCETTPNWSLESVKKVLIETRRLLDLTVEKLDVTMEKLGQAENKLTSTEQDLEITKGKLEGEMQKFHTFENNQVPIGYVYYEHHGQPSPRALWPEVQWADITPTYAGLFFRAFGADSAGFGSVQNSDAPTLTQARRWVNQTPSHVNVTIERGRMSPWLNMGSVRAGGLTNVMQFYVSDAEVRPRNAAIRIWKRIG